MHPLVSLTFNQRYMNFETRATIESGEFDVWSVVRAFIKSSIHIRGSEMSVSLPVSRRPCSARCATCGPGGRFSFLALQGVQDMLRVGRSQVRRSARRKRSAQWKGVSRCGEWTSIVRDHARFPRLCLCHLKRGVTASVIYDVLTNKDEKSGHAFWSCLLQK